MPLQRARRRLVLARGVSGAVAAAAAAGCGPAAVPGAQGLYGPAAAHQVRWGYEGELGPAHWGALSPHFRACGTGSAQSPINIAPGRTFKADWLQPLELNLRPSKYVGLNNGHTIQVNYERGSTLTYERQTYQLTQFHFHAPSEHLVHGLGTAMEMHLVFEAPGGGTAVVGVLLEEGEANPLLARFWHVIPEQVGMVTREIQLNVSEGLPRDPHYWAYDGSLTTPPCTEGVKWIVMKQRMPVSREQMSKFLRIIGPNARPIQPIRERLIKEL